MFMVLFDLSVCCLMSFSFSPYVVFVLYGCLFVFRCLCVVTCSACGVSVLSVLVVWCCVCWLPCLYMCFSVFVLCVINVSCCVCCACLV